MTRFAAVTAGVLVVVLGWAASALAAGQQLCTGAAGSAVTTPVSANTCGSGQTLITLANESEVASLQSKVNSLQSQVKVLQSKLSKVTYTSAGLNGKPTLSVSGANLQVNSGSGLTDGAVNGVGNVIIGYDENPQAYAQTGSNNLVLGNNQSFTSYGGLIDGQFNVLSGSFSDVFGDGNIASGDASSVSGGTNNTASGDFSSVSGGWMNKATANSSSVSGGTHNVASTEASSVAGGCSNLAGSGTVTLSLDCTDMTQFKGDFVSVAGGMGNHSDGQASAIGGGNSNTASGVYGAWVGGGYNNQATGSSDAISGGNGNIASGANTSILGGLSKTLGVDNNSQAGPTVFGP